MSEPTEIVNNYLTTAIIECSGDREKVESLTKLLLFVHNEVNEASRYGGTATIRDFLAKMITECQKQILDEYINQLIIDIEKGRNCDKYAQMMEDFYQRFVLEVPVDKKEFKKYESNNTMEKAVIGVITVIKSLPREDLQMINQVLRTGTKRCATASKAVPGTLVQRSGAAIAGVLVVAQLLYDAGKVIKLWWIGEITGKRCAKNLLEISAATIGAGGGGWAGATWGISLGAAGGTVGMAVGGFVGCVVGSMGGAFVGKTLMEEITLEIFDLPRTAAEENAYKYMGVSRHATNEEINRMYHKKALETHPDRQGGSAAAFNKLQIQLQIIRLARGLDQ